MSENNNKVVKLQGSIDLAALAGVQFLRIGPNKVPMICIPVQDNPSIFVPETKERQRRKALLDVDIIPTPKSKYNTHMAKATVGKANLEKYGLDRNNKDAMAVAEPILGNFNERDITPKGGPRDPMDAGYSQPADDLPGDDEW